jgi:hypothetical protein
MVDEAICNITYNFILSNLLNHALYFASKFRQSFPRLYIPRKRPLRKEKSFNGMHKYSPIIFYLPQYWIDCCIMITLSISKVSLKDWKAEKKNCSGRRNRWTGWYAFKLHLTPISFLRFLTCFVLPLLF